MSQQQILREAHLESWEELKKDLDLGEPYNIDFYQYNSVELPNGHKMKNISKYSCPSTRTFIRFSKSRLDIYYTGTKVPSKNLTTKTMEYLIYSVKHENIHNAIIELNPVQEAVRTYLEYIKEPKYLRKIGNLLMMFEEALIVNFLHNESERFNLNKELVYEGRRLEDLEWVDSKFGKYGYVEILKDLFGYFCKERPMGIDESILRKDYEHIKKKHVGEVWKLDYSNNWVKLKT